MIRGNRERAVLKPLGKNWSSLLVTLRCKSQLVFFFLTLLSKFLFLSLFSHFSFFSPCRSQHASMCRFSGTHGDVLKRHEGVLGSTHGFSTVFFQRGAPHNPHTKHTPRAPTTQHHRHHTTTTPHAPTHTTQQQHNTTTTQYHTETDTERQMERERG